MSFLEFNSNVPLILIMNIIINLILVCLFSLLSFFSYAYEPFLTDDASTLAKGKNQVDLYYYNIFNKAADTPDPNFKPLNSIIDINVPGEEFIGADRAIGFPIGYTRGISDNAEAGIGLTYYGFPTGSYTPITNYNIGVKYRFLGDAEDGFSFAVRPMIMFPSSTDHQSAGLGMALTGYGVNFIGAYNKEDYSLLFNFMYQHQPYNANYSVAGSYDPLRTELYQLSLAPIWNVTEKFHIGLDFGLVTNVVMTDDQKYNYFGMVAITYTPVEDVDLGISYLRVAPSLTDDFSNGYSSIFKLGISYRF
jgi:hypothetical protein